MKYLLKPITKQNQMNIDLYSTFTSDNSSQGLQINQNSDSIKNCHHNPCQNNFELQNESQNQNGNVNHFLNNFDNENSLNDDAFDNFCSQQYQIENSQINNHGFKLTEQECKNFLLGTLNKVRDKQNQIQIWDESRNNPSFTNIDDFQITNFEIENNNLNKVVKNIVIELDFNSFKSVEPNLNFDLPFPDFEIFNTTTLDFENEKNHEVVENFIKEDEFNEHNFLNCLITNPRVRVKRIRAMKSVNTNMI